MSDTLAISEVRVNGRHRKDLGDLDALAASIKDVGLVNPIAITDDGVLLAGHRRLEAMRKLGETLVPVTRIATLDDAAHRLRIERDENTCRENLRPSEAVALGRRLEDLERPQGKDRQGARNDLQPSRESRESSTKPYQRTTEHKVSSALGMSGMTYRRAKKVIEAAETGDAVALEAVEEMDRTGKVNPAYSKVTAQPPAPKKPFNATSPKNRANAEKAKERIERAVGNCNAMARGFDGLKAEWAVAVATPDEVLGWDESFRAAISAINGLRKRLKESP